jgi:hypothetical protein
MHEFGALFLWEVPSQRTSRAQSLLTPVQKLRALCTIVCGNGNPADHPLRTGNGINHRSSVLRSALVPTVLAIGGCPLGCRNRRCLSIVHRQVRVRLRPAGDGRRGEFKCRCVSCENCWARGNTRVCLEAAIGTGRTDAPKLHSFHPHREPQNRPFPFPPFLSFVLLLRAISVGRGEDWNGQMLCPPIPIGYMMNFSQ